MSGQPGGEFDLIEALFAAGADRRGAGLRLGIGDDASLHRLDAGMELVVSTDASLEGVHWPADFPLATAADKAVCAALSDLAAMGAQPMSVWLVAMARDRAALRGLAEGANAAIDRYALTLAGGDTVRSPLNGLAVTAAGTVPEGTAMLRSTAEPGQAVWLVGKVGFHALGLRQWLAGRRRGYFAQYLNEIRPKLDAGRRLRELGVRCCIDVSDGLVQDGVHLARASDVALEIEEERLPGWDVLVSRTDEATALEAALAGGEDYALLFTADESMRFLDGFASRIGRVREGEGQVVPLLHGRPVGEAFQGYDHFG
ncbi:MAG: thiamine-phosphate kinase [Mariprofundaceae bacterium]